MELEHCGGKLGRQWTSSKFSEKSCFVLLIPQFRLYVTIKPFLVCKGSGRMLSVTNTINEGRLKHKHPGPDVSTQGEEEAASRTEVRDRERTQTAVLLWHAL